MCAYFSKLLKTHFLLCNYSAAIYIIYSGINETKQRELELLVSCLHNHSANL